MEPPGEEKQGEADVFSIHDQVRESKDFSQELLVSRADPCQARAVEYARSVRTLVIHGPPGTGKSQTIANIIGDALAREQRVLFVCDKRTALDVVKYRLDALGLGQLCGVVHDPRIDRRALYMELRQRLDDLAEEKPIPSQTRSLKAMNRRLSEIHRELQGYFEVLHGAEEDAVSFHDMVGMWMRELHRLGDTAPELPDCPELDPAELERVGSDIEEIMRRSGRSRYADNPFREKLKLKLDDWLAEDPRRHRTEFEKLAATCSEFDRTHDPDLLPLNPDRPELIRQAEEREALARVVKTVGDGKDEKLLARFAALEEADRERFLQQIQQLNDEVAAIRNPEDRELSLQVKGRPLILAEINSTLALLAEYREARSKWYGFIYVKLTRQTKEALAAYGLGLDMASVIRLDTFLVRTKSRILLVDWLEQVYAAESVMTVKDDEMLSAAATAHVLMELNTVCQRLDDPDVTRGTWQAVGDPDTMGPWVDQLEGSAARARKMETTLVAIDSWGMFHAEALHDFKKDLCRNGELV
ncbi:MAG: AAA domain-containing protein, partial [Verrucomicrobiota bacterium]